MSIADELAAGVRRAGGRKVIVPAAALADAGLQHLVPDGAGPWVSVDRIALLEALEDLARNVSDVLEDRRGPIEDGGESGAEDAADLEHRMEGHE